MGYYTMFTFEIVPETYADAVKERIADISGYGEAITDGDSLKWYDCEDHMRVVSAEFPYALITVTGAGEESGDHWRMYCVSGIIERVEGEIVYPEMTIAPPVSPDRMIYWVQVNGTGVPVEIDRVLGEGPVSTEKRARDALRATI